MRRKRTACRIGALYISSAYFRDRNRNPEKICFAKEILRLTATQENLDCLLFPAGYLIVENEPHIKPAIRPIISLAKKLHISFVLGVDVTAINRFGSDLNNPKMLKAVKTGTMPCFLAVFNAATGKTSILRQRSCTNFQARTRILPDAALENRILDFGNGVSCRLLLCGEVYEERLFDQMEPRAAAVMGHWTMPRLARTLRAKAERGFSLINAEHRSGDGGTFFCYDRGADRSKCCDMHIDHDAELWGELAIFELDNAGRFRPAQ